MIGKSSWRLAVLVCLTAYAAFSATITFNGPVFVRGPNEGQPCTIGQPFCIIGDPTEFLLTSASLTTPSAGNPNWTLIVQTNYGVPLSGTTIPSYFSPEINGTFSIGDFLILWNNKAYGVVLSDHDGYTAANLYLSPNGFRSSQDVLSQQPNTNVFNPFHAVAIGNGSVQVGTGAITSIVANGDGSTKGKYQITASFSAPDGFLMGSPFSIDMSSYDCANGIVQGTGEFSGGGGGTPEPSTALLCLPALFAGVLAVRRKRRANAN